MAPSSIYEIEVGRRKPNPSTLRKLAKVLGVEIVDLLEEEERPKESAPESPKEWLEDKGALLLSLTEDELAVQFHALYAGMSETFANRVDKEWRAVKMAHDLAPDPNAQLVREAYAHAQSRYLQATALAPIATSYDPDDPEKPEQVTVYHEKPKKEAAQRSSEGGGTA
jgi:transcriptional regulator with XRE-family HTH domain